MIINGEENITGLVLKNKPYKENDMLLWIYTHDYGKLALIAKGVKKLKSKNAPFLSNYHFVRIYFYS